MNILVINNGFTYIGGGAGGDKIFVEFTKRWSEAGENLTVISNESGRTFCLAHRFPDQLIKVWPSSWTDRFGVFFSMAYKSIYCLLRSFFYPAGNIDVIFSSSFIWPDFLPGLVLKFKNPRIRLVVASYIFIVPPWAKNYHGKLINSLTLYLVQAVSLFLMKNFADGIFTASKYDAPRYLSNSRRQKLKAIPVRGGVDYDFFHKVPKQKKVFDGIFVGRFHPQKNIDELIDIWKDVVRQAGNKKLAIIGDGYLKNSLRTKVKDEKLEGSIMFLGRLDGEKKAKILKSSKIFCSASHFDSGNIALDEALACGIPGIVYNLPGLHYPAGVIKIRIGDTNAYTKAINMLLHDNTVYSRLVKEAIALAASLDWDITSRQALRFIKGL